jgi:hypothetical protein
MTRFGWTLTDFVEWEVLCVTRKVHNRMSDSGLIGAYFRPYEYFCSMGFTQSTRSQSVVDDEDENRARISKAV